MRESRWEGVEDRRQTRVFCHLDQGARNEDRPIDNLQHILQGQRPIAFSDPLEFRIELKAVSSIQGHKGTIKISRACTYFKLSFQTKFKRSMYTARKFKQTFPAAVAIRLSIFFIAIYIDYFLLTNIFNRALYIKSAKNERSQSYLEQQATSYTQLARTFPH